MTTWEDIQRRQAEVRRETLDALEARYAAGEAITGEDLQTACLRLGRNEGPEILFTWWGRMAPADRGSVLADVWNGAAYPERRFGTDIWVYLFRQCGFLSAAGQAAPVEDLTLYRGATWGRRRGMSWTRDRSIAQFFARRIASQFASAGPGHVFQCTAPAAAVLAYMDDPGGRAESEVVIDPGLLPPIRRADILETFGADGTAYNLPKGG